MNRRKLKAGFTLIELMVVILILGILAGVVGVAVVGIIQGSKVKLDATSLGEYTKQLSLALQDTRGAQVSSAYTAKGKDAAVLLQWLVQKEYVRYDFAKKLAGASGAEASDLAWKGDTPIDTQNACIFTAPNEGANFYRRATSTKATDGVFMCYNEYWYDRYEEDGMVVQVTGNPKAEVLKFVDIELKFAESKDAKAKPAKGDPSFYGKYPFTGITPK